MWGHTPETNKAHLVKWETVCKPKWCGGLGIKKSACMNQALLAKTGWHLLQQEQGLWAQVFKAKYLKHGGVLTEKDLHHKASSSVWRGVLYGSKALANGIRWRIGSGDDVLFWTDNWLSCGTLRQWATIDLSEELIQTKVSDFLDDGVWDTVCLTACLPDNIVKLITGMHVGFNGNGVDKRIWQFTSNGCFSVKTAYSSLMKDNNLKWKWHFL